jgi:hypothetical protein
MESMKVLSVRPPWSDLIALEIKPVEFRSWKVHYRGPVAIQASRTVDVATRDTLLRWLDRPREHPWMVKLGEDGRERLKGYLLHPRRGVMLCVADLVNIDKSEYHNEVLGFTEESYGWVFENVRRLKREIPLKGQQGLFSVRGSDLKRIQQSLFGATADLKLKAPVEKKEQDPTEGDAYIIGGRRYVKKGLFKVPVED